MKLNYEEFKAVVETQLEAFRKVDAKLALLCGEDIDKPADFRKWTPPLPKGDGWFPLQYSESEDGPYVMFARAKE